VGARGEFDAALAIAPKDLCMIHLIEKEKIAIQRLREFGGGLHIRLLKVRL
jgi:hypothetical protein